ncbi:MAG TPA: hypothetical protein VHC22_24125 [Pirellulales bacterium]|nr:hypothetical protein [Pirellulales bacterium]
MTPFLCVGDVVEFKLSAGTAWAGGFDGTIEIEQGKWRVVVDGKPVCFADDLPGFAQKLLTKGYTATGFADAPGRVVSASLTIDGASLSPRLTRDGKHAATRRTTGRFSICVTPAFNLAGAPKPDIVLQKSGTWRVRSSGQQRLTLEP